MTIDDKPKLAVYRLQIIYDVDHDAVGPEHEAPENLIFNTTSPPLIPRVGETYSPHDDPPEDVPSGWACVPWTVEDVDHTVWPEADRLVFETKVFVHRDKDQVSQVARENEARHPGWKAARGKTS